MTSDLFKKAPMAILSAALMAAVGLAGCAGDGMSFASYEDAKSAAGPTYAADDESQGDRIMLKLLQPSDPDNVEQGVQPIYILLYDATADAAVTDAEVVVESFHPAMGHGTDKEEDPTHQEYGVYKGQVNYLMAGEWVTHVDVMPADGTSHSYELRLQVQ